MFMKKILVGFVLILLLFSMNGFSQTTDRDLIAQKIRINYVPHPNTPPVLVITVPVRRVLITDGFIFGTTTENGMTNCAILLKQLFRPVGRGEADGQSSFQQMIANSLRITNDSVILNIYSDDQPLNAYAKANYLHDPEYRHEHIWPAGWRGDSNPGTVEHPNPGTHHIGFIHFGESFATAYGIAEMRRTLVHEIMHTQDYSDVRTHIWGRFGYGPDEHHTCYELIPNIADAFGEGIANSMTFVYSSSTINEAISWFANNELCIVETPPSDADIQSHHLPARANWIYTQISSTTPPGPGMAAALGYRGYHLADLKPRFLMHNEQIIGIIGAEYALKLGKSKYYQAIQTGNGSLFRVSTSAHARWFEALSTTAIPSGLSMNVIPRSSQPEMPYLFALALADYFTYYQSTTPEEFKTMIDSSFSSDWANLYWLAGRETVRRVAPITLTGGRPQVLNVRENIDAIAASLGIRNP